jgi:hypothetical protein
MAVKLPSPQKIKLSNGKTRTLYFGFDGKFVSKATYAELLGKVGRPPKARRGGKGTGGKSATTKRKTPVKAKRATPRGKALARTAKPTPNVW